jgi:hypothetical protein
MNTNEISRERAHDQIDILADINAMLDRTAANVKQRLLELRRDGYVADIAAVQRQAMREVRRLRSFADSIERACGEPVRVLEAAE